MNYLKLYNTLIEDARTNPKPDIYKESHHIIPKCLGGDNSKDNLINLTARQHYIAHWILYKIHKTPALVHAWNCMSIIGKEQDSRKQNSHLFEYCKKSRSAELSKQMTGSGNNFYGKTHSLETRQKLSNAAKGKKLSAERIKWFTDNVAKAPRTKEHCSKIGRSGRKMLQNVNTLEIIRVEYSDIRCQSSEWVNPRKLKPEQQYKCNYCDMVTTASNLSRWHNEKCKRKI